MSKIIDPGKVLNDIRAYINRTDVGDLHESARFSFRADDIAALYDMPNRCDAIMLAFEFGRAKGVRMERKRAAARKAGEV